MRLLAGPSRLTIAVLTILVWTAQPGIGHELKGGVWEIGEAGTFSHSVWTVEDGLPQNSVTDMIQSREGYLWLTTFGGLARFDGARFTTFQTADYPELIGNRMTSIMEDREGALWIGHESGEITRFQDGAFESFTPADDGLPAKTVIDITQDGAGIIWFGAGRELVELRNGRFTTFPGEDGGEFGAASLLVDKEGTLWVYGVRGLHRYEDERFQLVMPPLTSAPGFHLALSEAQAGGVLIAVPEGTFHRRPDGTIQKYFSGPDTEFGVGGLIEDQNGYVWAGILPRSSPAHLAIFDPPNPAGPSKPAIDPRWTMSLDYGVRSILRDREGNIWVGTDGAGLHRFRRRPLAEISTADGLEQPGVNPIIDDGEGGLIGGNWFGDLARVRPDRIETISRPIAPSDHRTRALLNDAFGNLWIAIGPTLWRRTDSVDERLPDSGVGEISIIFEDRSGTIWLGGTNGLAAVRDDSGFSFTEIPDFVGISVLTIIDDGGDGLWIGSDVGVFRLRNDRVDPLEPGAYPLLRMVRALHLDAGGNLWIGTYGGGLARLNDGVLQRITAENGLPDELISSILEDDRDRLWISSNSFLFVIDRHELNAFLDGSQSFFTPVSFGRKDGWREAWGSSQPAGLKDDDGRLWFCTIDGLVMVDPARHPSNLTPPPVLIEGIRLNGAAVDPNAPLQIPPGQHDLVISYTALSLSRPEYVRFRHKMAGVYDDWLDTGSRRIAYFSNLPAGDYEFAVVAANDEGVWNQEPVTFAVSVAAPFWSTWWFKLAASIVVVAVAAAGARFWSRRLRRRNLALQREIDERKRMVEVLRKSETEFRTLFEAAGDGIMIIQDEVIVACNERLGEIFGFPRNELIGITPWDPIITPPDQPDGQTSEDRGRAMLESAGQGEVMSFEWPHVRSDGEPIQTEVSLRRLESGAHQVVLAHVRDITTRKRLEEELRQSQKMEAIGQLAGGVAHDFNNMLTVIGAYTDLIKTDAATASPEELEDWCRQVLKANESATALTRQLLAFGRRQIIQPQVVDVNTAAENLEKMLRRLIGPEIDLDFRLGDGLGPVLIDPGQIEQIILNLVINARDAMPGGGTVKITTGMVDIHEPLETISGTTPPGSYVSIEVKDIGCGIDGDRLPRIFEPFYTTKEVGKGTGLGLSTVFGAVKQSEGAISVESIVDVGTTVRVLLPCVEDSAEPKTTADGELANFSGNETILVVDDEAMVRAIVTQTLRTLGYTALEAKDGETAVGILSDPANTVDLLFSDLRMPGMSGTDLALEARSHRPGLPIVFMSGYADSMLEELNRNIPLLEKPFQLVEMAAMLRRTLDVGAEVSTQPESVTD